MELMVFFLYTSCVPKCMGGCKNGRCESPDKCSCATNYKFDGPTGHCLSICNSGCPNGFCSTPGVCKCNVGFTLNTTSQVCHPNCQNGYKLDLNLNRCLPECSTPCDNGFCSAPETCECNEKYQKNTDKKCVPTFKDGCSNGTIGT